MKDFENRVAFITGAAHGQGRATALALAKEGADIVAFDVAKKIEYPNYDFGTNDELETLKKEIEALGRKAVIAVGDVRDDAAVTAAVEKAIAIHIIDMSITGRVRIWCHSPVKCT